MYVCVFVYDVCMYIYMYVRIYVCVCLCVYICMYIYVYIYIYMCVCIDTYMYVGMYVHKCACMYMYMYVTQVPFGLGVLEEVLLAAMLLYSFVHIPMLSSALFILGGGEYWVVSLFASYPEAFAFLILFIPPSGVFVFVFF